MHMCYNNQQVYTCTSAHSMVAVQKKLSLCFHLLHNTARLSPPQLVGTRQNGSIAIYIFTLGGATAERSERYISSLERTDLGVPLEVEFEETQSSGVAGDMIDRNMSVPGVVYSVQIWSINGASFSEDPLAPSVTLQLDTGKEYASIDI